MDNILFVVKSVLLNNLPEDICINICDILKTIKLKEKINIKIKEIHKRQNIILKEIKGETGGYVIIHGIYYDKDIIKFYNEIKFYNMSKRI